MHPILPYVLAPPRAELDGLARIIPSNLDVKGMHWAMAIFICDRTDPSCSTVATRSYL